VREISLHLLDIIENSISAGAACVMLDIVEDHVVDILKIRIVDDGRGMDAETVKKISDPFYTTRTTRKVGLGIPLLKAAAEACNGYLSIESEPGKGTTVTVAFQHSHIDRMPLGDIPTTMLGLIIGSPEVHWKMRYESDGQEFLFDDAEIKQALEGIPLSDPDVIRFISAYLKDGIELIHESQMSVSLQDE